MSSKELDTRTRILETTWKMLESSPGKSPSMSAIAKACELSRQALYLHFASRTELLIATTRYVDEVKQLEQRLEKLQKATTGEKKLQAYVQVWGNYIPEIYGVAKALMMSKETDDDARAAWDEIMGCLHGICLDITALLKKEKKLARSWTVETAADFIWTLSSIHNWEQLTQVCKWTNDSYVAHVQKALLGAIVIRNKVT